MGANKLQNLISDNVLFSDPFNYFQINHTSGELRTNTKLDREKLADTNGVLSLTVKVRNFVTCLLKSLASTYLLTTSTDIKTFDYLVYVPTVTEVTRQKADAAM